MEKEAAVQKVFNDVYVPVFLEECQRHGVKFASLDEINSALSTAAMLKQAGATVEQPAPKNSIVKQAALDLAEALNPQPAQVDQALVDALSTI